MAVKLNPVKQVERRLRIEAKGPVQAFMTETCYKAMDKYVPKSTGTDGGTLRDIVDLQTDKIIYQTPYAHYQYTGILYVDPNTGSSWAKKDVTKVPTSTHLHYHTAGTGHHWDKRMWSADKEKVLRQVEKKIRSGV